MPEHRIDADLAGQLVTETGVGDGARQLLVHQEARQHQQCDDRPRHGLLIT